MSDHRAYLCRCEECRQRRRPLRDPQVVDLFEGFEEEGVAPPPEPGPEPQRGLFTDGDD